MTEDEQQQLHAALEQARSEKKPWVAFKEEPEKELRPADIYFFASAANAEKFCDSANGPDYFGDELFNRDQYIFLQTEMMAASLGIKNVVTVWDDAARIDRQMAAQNLQLPPGHHLHDLEKALFSGFFYPVLHQRMVDPAAEIADFHIIGHRHNGGQIYEIGHSHWIMDTFGNYRDARNFLDTAVFQSELAEKDTDYLLIGRYYNKSLELDMEGYALPHSGLTFVTAHHKYGKRYDYNELQKIHDPATTGQYFMAAIRDGRLRLYNDRLEPTTPGDLRRTFYPTHFNNKPLIIKNSKTMNENSFDYVKNQLFYLGFGEEIAQPLRAQMEQDLAAFTLTHTRKFGGDEAHSILHFSKGDQPGKDMTFFNRLDLTLKQPGKEDLTQTFFVGNERKFNYTLQERYNMMDGRAVRREQPVLKPKEENGETKLKPTGETYTGWKQLDFKESDGYGNFLAKTMFWDHVKELGQYPIKGIDDNYDRQRIINRLEKGNKADVTLLRDGQETPAKVAANPRMARLEFYDSNGQSLIVRKVEKQALDQSEKVEMTPQQVQKAAIARSGEQGIPNGENQKPGEAQKNDVKQIAADERKTEQRRGHRQGVRP